MAAIRMSLIKGSSKSNSFLPFVLGRGDRLVDEIGEARAEVHQEAHGEDHTISLP